MSKRQPIIQINSSPELTVEFNETDEDPPLAGLISDAIISAARGEGRRYGRISVIIAGDEQLQRLNSDYLNDDTPTDVLAFDLADVADALVEGDIFISLPRAAQQAAERNQTTSEEIVRLAVHGFLHLCGWDHDDDAELQAMVDRGEIYVQSTVREA